MKPVFVALTGAGLATARRAADALGGAVHVLATAIPRDSFSHRERVDVVAFTDAAAQIRTLFLEGRPLVGICAAGILIRILAPLLADKREEPPVVAVSEDGASVVPLFGGHRGANDLARKLAAALGGHAAITTAGDDRFGIALDAPPEGWTLANPDDAKPVMAALLAGASARLEGHAPWLGESSIPFADDGAVRLVATVKSSSPHRGEVGRAERRPGEGISESPLTRPLRGHPLPDGERNAAAALTLVFHPRRLAVGIGCERDADPSEAIALLRRTLAEADLAEAAVALVASIDVKADEPAVLDAAKELGVPARFFTAAALEAETPRLKNPSEAVFREVGAHGVAEAAAFAAAGREAKLVVAKQKSARVTCAIAEAPEVIDAKAVGRARGKLAIVGIGPGSAEWLTPEARRLLEESDAAVGYSLYLDLVAPLVAGAERFDSPLGAEEERVRQALALAAQGRAVALISSGDAGIYALATLVFECLDVQEVPPPQRGGGGPTKSVEGAGAVQREYARPLHHASHGPPPPSAMWEEPTPLLPAALPSATRRIEIIVSPGVSAMQAAAARAGAPLGHDFCAISLSDLLTPWEAIEARINAAAEGDFVIAFYNPVSQRRRTQLAEAKRILLEHRPRATPVVLAKNLGRAGEAVSTTTLAELSVDDVDMLTLVLVGASTTRQVKAAGRTFTYTPRGYDKKRSGGARQPSPPVEEGAPSLREGAGEGS